MDDPPGDFLIVPIANLFAAFGSVFVLVIVAIVLAAALAAARTALYFAGLVGKEHIAWTGTSADDRLKADQLLSHSRLLTVAIQFYHTVVRVFAVMGLSALSLMTGNENIFFGVIAPAVLTIVLSEAFARLFARKYPVKTLSLLYPMVVLVRMTMLRTARLLDGLNLKWHSAFGNRRTPEEALAQVIELAAAAESETEKEVVKGIVNFGVLRVRDVMKEREAIRCINTSSNFDEVIASVNACGYSRIPVFNGSIDQVEGVLYTKDVLPFFEHGKDFPWVNIIRPGYFVSANKKIDALLKDFQEKRVHIAIVRDEQGKTVGLITLEDLIELVIREINEETDQVESKGYTRIDDLTFVFSGKTSVREVFRLMDIEHPLLREPTEFESLEDFIVEINDELPEVGEELSYDQFTFVVEAVENKRIKRVRVNVHAQA
ncbi:MAG: transporter associated domain-containing protein [Chryseolinea sp.]